MWVAGRFITGRFITGLEPWQVSNSTQECQTICSSIVVNCTLDTFFELSLSYYPLDDLHLMTTSDRKPFTAVQTLGIVVLFLVGLVFLFPRTWQLLASISALLVYFSVFSFFFIGNTAASFPLCAYRAKSWKILTAICMASWLLQHCDGLLSGSVLQHAFWRLHS